MSQKQINRYTIGIITKIETRKIEGTNYVKELLANINKYNNNKNNPYFLGDIDINYQTKVALFKRYKKVTIPKTLEEIDKSTTNFNSEHELKRLYGINLRNNHPLVIMFRAKKRIKTLPILYKKDIKYLDKSYTKENFIENGKDINFINMILKNSLIETSSRDSLDDFDYLYALRETHSYEIPPCINLTPMRNFYESFTHEGNKFNYYNFRQLLILLKEYEKTQVQEEQTEEEPELLGQLKIEEYAMQELRDFYEELKLSITDKSLEEIYEKKLIKRHKTTK